MSHSTTSKQRELLNTQNNAEADNNSNSSQLIEREQVKHSPFWIVGTTEKGYFLTMGKYKISPTFKSKLELLVYKEECEWEIVITIAGIIASDLIMQNETQRNETQRKNGKK